MITLMLGRSYRDTCEQRAGCQLERTGGSQSEPQAKEGVAKVTKTLSQRILSLSFGIGYFLATLRGCRGGLVGLEFASTFAPVQNLHRKQAVSQGKSLRTVHEIAVSIKVNCGDPVVVSSISVVNDICSKQAANDGLIGPTHGEFPAQNEDQTSVGEGPIEVEVAVDHEQSCTRAVGFHDGIAINQSDLRTGWCTPGHIGIGSCRKVVVGEGRRAAPRRP